MKPTMVLALAVLSCKLSQSQITASQQADQSEAERTVAAVLADGGHPPILGFLETLVGRLGDDAAVGVIQYLGNRKSNVSEDSVSPDEIRRILYVVRTAFSTPRIIESGEKRSPKATLVLLKYLGCLPSARAVKRELDDTGAFVEQITLEISKSATSVPSQGDVAAIALPRLNLDGNPLEIFTQTVLASGASGGITISDSACSHGSKQSLVIGEGTTLGEALDEIGSATHATWQFSEGAVNMFPAGGIPPLLETRIRGFQWDQTVSAAETVARLLAIEEVGQRARELGLKPGVYHGGSSAICIMDCSAKPKPEPVTRVEKDATLLSILNRIAAAHNRVIWSYSEYHCDNEARYTFQVSAE